VALVAELQPAAVVPLRALVTAVRAPASPGRTTQPRPDEPAFTNSAFHPGEAVTDVKEAPAPVHLASVPPLDTVVPLTAELRRVHYTVSRRFLEKLERARDALSHSNPGASVEEILEKGLDLILDRSAKRKGLVAKPRKAKEGSLPPVRGSRYVPRSGAPSGSGTAGGASTGSLPARSMARPTRSRSTTGRRRSRGEALPPWTTFAALVNPAMTSTRGRCSGMRGWTGTRAGSGGAAPAKTERTQWSPGRPPGARPLLDEASPQPVRHDRCVDRKRITRGRRPRADPPPGRLPSLCCCSAMAA